MHSPDPETFRQLAKDHTLIPVYRRLTSDLLTPVSAFHKIDSSDGACLFESVIGGEKVGRYSFLAARPYMTFTATRDQVTIVSGGETKQETTDDPLGLLRKLLAEETVAQLEDLPPFVGGAVGYAAYDIVRYSENLPEAPEDDRALPDLSFDFYDAMVIFDNVNKSMVVVTMARVGFGDGENSADVNPAAVYSEASKRVDALVEELLRPDSSLRPAEIDLTRRGLEDDTPAVSNFEQSEFESSVRKCVEYIEAGDIFQVVISQRLEVPLRAPAFEIYRTLRIVNPSPFMFYVRTGDVTLVGSSPEVMCRVVGDEVTVRPLAGTRPRGETAEEDTRLAEQLLADPKECAEHVMLVDLGRNDVGRVAKYGSVELTDIMTIERYSHVMHISSNVVGKLLEEYDAIDALQACLPAGTVSGAPKVRAMQIIDEIERNRRGPYAGAVGYFDFSGNMDTCIALRTMVIHDDKVYVQAGAGIVADSDPQEEYQETLNKARGLLKAIEIAEQRC